MTLVLACLLLLGFGFLAGGVFSFDWARDRVGRFALRTLAGLLLLASAGNAVLFLGGGKSGVLALGAGVVILGVWRVRKTGRVPGASGRLGLCVLPCLALWFAVPVQQSLLGPAWNHDAAYVWWPKVEELAAGESPIALGLGHPHKQSHYPRGLAVLQVMGWPRGRPTPQFARLLGIAFLGLASLVALEVAAARCGRRAGVLAVFLVVGVPEVLAHASVGTADVPLSAALLLVGVGLGRSDRGGFELASVAAVGAAAMKQEGLLVLLFVGLAWVFQRDGLRGALRGFPRGVSLRAWAPLGLFVLILPYAKWAFGVPQPYASTWSTFARTPAMLWARMSEVARELPHVFTGPEALAAVAPLATAAAVPVVPWCVLVAALLLLPRGPRCLVVWPMGALLVVDLCVAVTTPYAVRWHLASAGIRLLVQVAPVMILAAWTRVFAAPPEVPSRAGASF